MLASSCNVVQNCENCVGPTLAKRVGVLVVHYSIAFAQRISLNNGSQWQTMLGLRWSNTKGVVYF